MARGSGPPGRRPNPAAWQQAWQQHRRRSAHLAAGFSGWLRHNAEHYLLVDAHRRIAANQGSLAPRPPHGAKDIFWLRVFVPAYRLLPWRVRHRVMRAMPGSHRKTWASPPTRTGPAV